jgi:serine/threonine protein kinase
MSYLGQKGIIHRDLAARNILVASEEMVKISDFGLARSAEKGYYVMSSSTNIPVKWLAIECLTRNLYSFSSDVWSFGVTLWEMFSFGASPFLDGCESFFKAGASDELQRENLRDWLSRLDEGLRMPRPKECPAALYRDVMMVCWHEEPARRPTFSELKGILNKISLQVT